MLVYVSDEKQKTNCFRKKCSSKLWLIPTTLAEVSLKCPRTPDLNFQQKGLNKLQNNQCWCIQKMTIRNKICVDLIAN